MKHYSDIVSKEVVTNLVRKLTYVECDECSKKIIADIGDSDSTRYVRVHTWHNDWGNDSVESHEYYDLCPECATKFITSYILDMNGTMHIDCSNEYAWRGETLRTSTCREEK